RTRVRGSGSSARTTIRHAPNATPKALHVGTAQGAFRAEHDLENPSFPHRVLFPVHGIHQRQQALQHLPVRWLEVRHLRGVTPRGPPLPGRGQPAFGIGQFGNFPHGSPQRSATNRVRGRLGTVRSTTRGARTAVRIPQRTTTHTLPTPDPSEGIRVASSTIGIRRRSHTSHAKSLPVTPDRTRVRGPARTRTRARRGRVCAGQRAKAFYQTRIASGGR